jgi:hypothetical protein
VAGILAWFEADPDIALSVADIAIRAYGVELSQVKKAHRVAVLRAMRRACDLEQRFGLLDGEGPQGQTIIFDRVRVLSYGLARLKADHVYHYQWSRVPKEDDGPEDEASLRARLAPGGGHHAYVTANGGWWRHADEARAELEGDRETAAKLRAEREADWAAIVDVGLKAGFLRKRRPPPEVPAASWQDVKAWCAALDRALWRRDQRYILVKWIKAAGGVAHKWSFDLPEALWSSRAAAHMEGYARRCSFTRGISFIEAEGVSSLTSKSQRKH